MKVLSTFLFLVLSIHVFSQGTGSFVIHTEPSGADIKIKGLPDIKKQSPYSFTDYLPNKYLVQISKNGCEPLDTLISCEIGQTKVYDLKLNKIQGLLNVYTLPQGADVYIDDVLVGQSPIDSLKVEAGARSVKIQHADYKSYQQVYHVIAGNSFDVMHDFTMAEQVSTTNLAYSQPSYSGMKMYHDEEVNLTSTSSSSSEKDTTKTSGSDLADGFGTVGFFWMTGKIGLEGRTTRFGMDVYHILRLNIEQNKEADLSGFGLSFILPIDLGGVGIYGGIGFMMRSYSYDVTYQETSNYSSSYGYDENYTTTSQSNSEREKASITMATLTLGLSIRPCKHFQLFGEIELATYDEDEEEENIEVYESNGPKISNASAWAGVRIAF